MSERTDATEQIVNDVIRDHLNSVPTPSSRQTPLQPADISLNMPEYTIAYNKATRSSNEIPDKIVPLPAQEDEIIRDLRKTLTSTQQLLADERGNLLNINSRLHGLEVEMRDKDNLLAATRAALHKAEAELILLKQTKSS